MAIQSQPSRIPEPFAGSGTKNTIPATNTTPSASQAASWASGFPPECSQPLSAGGCPVPRNDVNGALNQLSQDFAFRQDGGIWSWSAQADYDLQRMVRGSDGTVYWSVAQSGPGTAAGAQDPTADAAQAYWSAMPMATPPLAEDSGRVATTEWVRDLAVAPVYVDPAGSDSNDGMSAATAVQTLQQALNIAVAKPDIGSAVCRINVAPGTYTGGLSLDTHKIQLNIKGSVTISGDVSVYNTGLILVFGDSTPSLSISGMLSVARKSYFYSDSVPISIAASSAALNVSYGSTCVFSSSLDVSVSSSSGIAVSARAESLVVFNGNLTIGTQGISTASTAISASGLSEIYIPAITLTVNNSWSNCILAVTGNSYVFVSNSATIPTAATISGVRFRVNTGGQINVVGAGTSRIPGTSEGVTTSSSFGFYG